MLVVRMKPMLGEIRFRGIVEERVPGRDSGIAPKVCYAKIRIVESSVCNNSDKGGTQSCAQEDD